MKTLAILSLLLLAGCEAHVQVSSDPTPDGKVEQRLVPVSKLTDKQKIAILRTEAHKRHIKWRVFCVDSGPDWQFQGWAVQPGADFHAYIEDGAKADWSSHAATEADAAYGLYLAIQRDPKPPTHSPNSNEFKKTCPPELRGD